MIVVKKAVALMILNEENEMLILKRGKDSRYESGKWEQCGGAVESGESFENAAKREAFEELGIDINIIDELLYDKFSDMGDGIIWEVKLLQVKALGEPKIMEPNKCEEMKWVTKNDLIKMKNDLVTHFKEDLKKLGWL